MRTLSVLLAATVLSHCVARSESSPAIVPVRLSAPVAHDPDDPAIWISPLSPARSLIVGTDKVAIDGALYVFNLDGSVRQIIHGLDRPNNVDIEYGLRVNNVAIDIAVVTERKQHRLRVFGIPADGGALVDLAPDGLPVLTGETGEASEPMGIALYRRPSDSAIFAIVAPKTGGASNYLWQYRIAGDARGQVRATFVRRFGAFSRSGPTTDGAGEIEAVVADDELGYVYYSDERFGIRKYPADPDAVDADVELAAFGTDGYLGDREGLAIFATGAGTGYLLSSDQVNGGTRVMIYPREGSAGNAHAHPRLALVPTSADATDGLDATPVSLPGFPSGLLVMMNSGVKNFQFYDAGSFIQRLRRPRTP
jgi:3-phytase